MLYIYDKIWMDLYEYIASSVLTKKGGQSNDNEWELIFSWNNNWKILNYKRVTNRRKSHRQ